MKVSNKANWSLILVFILLLFYESTDLWSEKIYPFSASFWFKEGFSLEESAKLTQASGKTKEEFRIWLDSWENKKRNKVLAILRRENIILVEQKSRNKTDKDHQKNSSTNGNLNDKKLNIKREEFFFIGGSYQNIDSRYMPLELRNHSSVFIGQQTDSIRWSLEKRDNKLVGSASLEHKIFHVHLGNRYKPLPNFYFAKDQNFFSNFDHKDSHLPQPLNESYFAGIKVIPSNPFFLLGVYSAKSVSQEPGVYLVSVDKKYSMTWSPYSRIGSFYINETKNFADWKLNLQGEVFGRNDNFIGFAYLRGHSEKLNLKVDATTFRDNQLLSVPTSEMVDKNTVKQDLGYSRLRYREYFVLEGLTSREGLRIEQGYGLQVPLIFGDYGAIAVRYRNYNEYGFYEDLQIGRGLFYEYRKDKTTISLGGEKRGNVYQNEGKIAYALNQNYYIEFSCIYRDSGIKMRSWFENWSYATDFNVNLIDRKEIWKVKFIGKDLALNVSISEKMDSPTYIYYANFQFNYRF